MIDHPQQTTVPVKDTVSSGDKNMSNVTEAKIETGRCNHEAQPSPQVESTPDQHNVPNLKASKPAKLPEQSSLSAEQKIYEVLANLNLYATAEFSVSARSEADAREKANKLLRACSFEIFPNAPDGQKVRMELLPDNVTTELVEWQESNLSQ